MAKKNQLRLIESLQASLEAEARSKAEVIRSKKKLEADIQELEAALDHISRVRKKERKKTKDLKEPYDLIVCCI